MCRWKHKRDREESACDRLRLKSSSSSSNVNASMWGEAERGREENREEKTKRGGLLSASSDRREADLDSRCWRIERLSQTHGASDTWTSTKLLKREGWAVSEVAPETGEHGEIYERVHCLCGDKLLMMEDGWIELNSWQDLTDKGGTDGIDSAQKIVPLVQLCWSAQISSSHWVPLWMLNFLYVPAAVVHTGSRRLLSRVNDSAFIVH